MRIQSYDPNQVAVQESKGGHLDVRVPQENLGTGLAQGISDAATAINKGVQEANRLRSTSAVNDVLDLTNKLQQQATAIKGQDASDPGRNGGKSLSEVYGAQFDEAVAKIVDGSKMNADTKAAVAEHVREIRRGFVEQIDNHTKRELDTWKTSVYSGNVNKLAVAIQGLQTMPAGPVRDGMLSAYSAAMESTAAEEAKRKGLDPAAAAAAAKSTSVSVLVNTLMANDKGVDAKQVFDAAKTAGALSAADIDKLEPVVNAQADAARGQAAGVAMFNRVKSGELDEVTGLKELAKLEPKAYAHAAQMFGHLNDVQKNQDRTMAGKLADSVFNMRNGEGKSTAYIRGSSTFIRLMQADGTLADSVLRTMRAEDRAAAALARGEEGGFSTMVTDMENQVKLNKIVTEEPILNWSREELMRNALPLGKKFGGQLIAIYGQAKASPGKWAASMKDITGALALNAAYVGKNGKLTPEGAQLAVKVKDALDDRDNATGKVVHPSPEDVVAFTQRMSQQHILTKGRNLTTDVLSIVEAPKLLDADKSIVVGGGNEPKFINKLWAAIPQPDKVRLWNKITARPEWQGLSKEQRAATNNMVLRAWVREYEAGQVKLLED